MGGTHYRPLCVYVQLAAAAMYGETPSTKPSAVYTSETMHGYAKTITTTLHGLRHPIWQPSSAKPAQ
jgi:hypothetical protein